MPEQEVQGISLKKIFSDDPVAQVVGLLLALLTVILLGIFGFKIGVKVAFFTCAVILGYSFFRGMLFLAFVAFLGLVSGIMLFSFPLVGEVFVSIGPGEFIVLVVAIFFVLLYREKKTVRPDPFKLPLLIIFAWSIVSLIRSVDILVSLFVLGVMLIGYLVYRWMIEMRAESIDRFFDFVIFIAAFFVILCVLHYLFSPYRVEVMAKYKSVFAGRYSYILAGPNSMAGVITSLFPMILLSMRIKSFPYKLFWGFMGLCGVFVLYITASRNGYVASGLTIIATVLLVTRRKYRIPAVISILAVMLFLSTVVFPGIFVRMSTIINYELDISALSRFILWQQALVAAKDNFLTGVGIGTFYYLPMSLNLLIAHNQLLNMLAETGIIGGLGYIVLLYCIFRILIHTYILEKRKNSKKFLYAGSLIASWIGFTFHNIFDGIWMAPHHTKEHMFFWLLLALTVITTRKNSGYTVGHD